MTPLHITDHAVVRYIERVLGFDVDQIRDRIRRVCEDAAKAGAVSVTHEGFSYKFSPNRAHVITVTPSRPNNRKGRR